MEETIVMDGIPMSMDGDPYFDDFNNFNRHVFDDDVDDVLRSHGRGRTDLRAHLDDLARRHPEFAEHLRSPPGWVSDFHSSGGGGGSSSSSSGGHFAGSFGGSAGQEGGYFNEKERSNPTGDNQNQQKQPQQQQQQPPPPPPPPQSVAEEKQRRPSENNQESVVTGSFSSGPPSGIRDNLSQHGLRNTDPEIGLKGQAAVKEERNQRSMSAPPDNRTQSNADKPQRFVSKIEINPVNPATGETAGPSNSDNNSGKPPMAPPKQQPQQHQGTPPQHKQSTVRHIPIFVEGRDEPVLPKNIDEEYTIPVQRPAQQFSSPHPQQQFHNQPQQQFHPQQPQRKSSQQYQQHQPQTNRQQPQPSSTQPKENVQQQQQFSQPQAEKKQKVNNDPMYQIQLVQDEVNELHKKIDEYKGSSRVDKEYIYLDEMLTRNLIKLDVIETEGKENVRAARKETIKSIQQCINLLESKVPQTPITQTPSSSDINEGSENKMDVDENKPNSDGKQSNPISEQSCVDKEVKQSMETDQQSAEQLDKSGESNKTVAEGQLQQKQSSENQVSQQNIDAKNQPTADSTDKMDVSNPANANEIKC